MENRKLCTWKISQLERLDDFVKRRNQIADQYNELFKGLEEQVIPLTNKYYSAYHIYVVKFNVKNIGKSRDEIFRELKNAGIGVNVHYMPIYLHPYYQNLGYKKGLCPIAEKVYEEIITLPIYPLLTNNEINKVVYSIKNTINYNNY